jgi:hypothetical protein
VPRPDWSTVAAREHAKLIKRQVDQGLDPLAMRDERRTAPTVKDLIERYLTEHVPRLAPDSASDYRSMMMTYVMPAWGQRKVIDIRRSDVDQLLVEIAYQVSKWSIFAPDHHGYPRASRLTSGKTSLGRHGIQFSGCAGQTVRPSLHTISHPRALGERGRYEHRASHDGAKRVDCHCTPSIGSHPRDKPSHDGSLGI